VYRDKQGKVGDYKVLPHLQMMVLFGMGTMTKEKMLLINPTYLIIIYLMETNDL